MEVALADGRTVSMKVLDPHGTPADPCTAVEAEAKFRLLAGVPKTSDAVERIIDAVRNLPSAASLTRLSHELRAGDLVTAARDAVQLGRAGAG